MSLFSSHGCRDDGVLCEDVRVGVLSTRPCSPADVLPTQQEEFHSENVRKIQDLYKYDCLRANKSTMAWGVEAR